MRSMWRLRRYAQGLIPHVILACMCMGAAAWLNLLSVTRTQPVFQGLLKILPAQTIDRGEWTSDILHRALILWLTVLAAALVNGGSLFLGDYIGQRLLVRLREEVFAHLQGLSLAFFERRRSGELISRVNNDTMVLQRVLGLELFKVFVGPLTVILMIVKMVMISPILALTLAVVIPLAALFTTITGRYARRYARRTQEKLADLTAASQETFAAMRVVKTFGLERQSQERYDTETRGVFAAEIKTAIAKAASVPPVMGIVGLATAATLVLGGLEILHGRLTADQLVVFLLLMELAAAHLNSTSRIYIILQSGEAAAERTLDLMNERADVDDAPDALELSECQGAITFDHVTFSYGGEHPVLNDFCLDIQAGEVVALAGPSGAGKTTVANLVPRLYDVEAGRVLIDGVDVRQVRQASLKRFMGIVPQETVLFGTTIRQNIGYGREGATEEEIIAAARHANAHDFIMSLPEGYDTQVGERGVRLSGGQRQRIAIARAFLRDPRILILDEATSSLDAESEAAVHAALATLLEGRTALIIAHRLSTIKNADRIVVMSGGRIAEQGTHDELLQQDGLYRRLYETTELMGDEEGEPGDPADPEGREAVG